MLGALTRHIYRASSPGTRRTAAGAALTAVALVSLAPVDSIPLQSWWLLLGDKVAHAVLYAGLAGTLVFAWPERLIPHRHRLSLIVAACAAYGAILEAMQHALTPFHRQFSFADMAANTVGAACGTALCAHLLAPALTPTTPQHP